MSAYSQCGCGCEVIFEKPCETCHNPPCNPCERPCSCNPCESCQRPPCSQCENPCKPCHKPCECERPPCKHCERPCCGNSCCEQPCYEKSCCERPPCEKPCYEKPCCERPSCENTCCDKPCYEKPCCERPPCTDCTQAVAVITTVEVVENCPAYEEVIYNDEPYLIETNHTITSTYNITQNELEQQQLEAQQFQHEQELARKGLCGGGGLFHGIKHDEEQNAINVNGSLLYPIAIGANNQSKGHLIAGIANVHNKPPTKPCQITSGWACRKMGRFPHPSHCQKYVFVATFSK